MAGFVIFSVLDTWLKMQGLNVSDVGMEGEGLVFIVSTVMQLPQCQEFFWAILFHADNSGHWQHIWRTWGIWLLVCVMSFPKTLGKHRELFVLVLLGGIFVVCLPVLMEERIRGYAQYVWKLNPSSWLSLETIGVFGLWGLGSLWWWRADDWLKPLCFWRVCWKFISPLFLHHSSHSLQTSLSGWDGALQKTSLYAKALSSWLGFLGWCMTFIHLAHTSICHISIFNKREHPWKDLQNIYPRPYFQNNVWDAQQSKHQNISRHLILSKHSQCLQLLKDPIFHD